MWEVRRAEKMLSMVRCPHPATMMLPPDQSDLRGAGGVETTVVDTVLFAKLLTVVSAAAVFRQQYAVYYQRQAALAAQGHTLEQLMAMNQELFDALQQAEERLMAAVDALEDLTTP
jgi:hypothetical protein